MAEHTPGETAGQALWRESGEPTPGPYVVFECEDVYSVLPAMRLGELATGIKREPDAFLFAASIDLLAACEEAQQLYLSEEIPNVESAKRVFVVLGKAIAKAKSQPTKTEDTE